MKMKTECNESIILHFSRKLHI